MDARKQSKDITKNPIVHGCDFNATNQNRIKINAIHL
jgi:hypothetical protein